MPQTPVERAKSLLVVKEGLTFLDFIARQVLYLRVQDHLRGRGLARMALKTLFDRYGRDGLEWSGRSPVPRGTIEPSTPDSDARFGRLFQSARGEPGRARSASGSAAG